MKTVIIPQGDRRFDKVAEHFEQNGTQVLRGGFPHERAAYLFSLGEKGEKLLSAADLAAPESLFFVGRQHAPLLDAAKKKGICIVPLLEDPAYLASNARATAQGALGQLLTATPRVLEETAVLIIGYGNCGRALAQLLRRNGCKVRIHSNPGSLARAKGEGFSPFDLLGNEPFSFDAIVNTVPAPIFTSEILERIPGGTAWIQIASGLSGLDPWDLKARSLPFYPLPGLPGVVAPETEADAIYRLMARHLFKFKEESE
ncbi:MAG: hypothetical protein IKJ74_03400 [Clostridia bacterium]|nr:hypothetical protein [Clostridia bacterium]